MAKSKAFKAAKSQQRDEDLEATEALDTNFTGLLDAGGLAGLVKPKGARHMKKVADKNVAPPEGDDAEFDRFRRELIFEAKGQVRLTPFNIAWGVDTRFWICILLLSVTSLLQHQPDCSCGVRQHSPSCCRDAAA